MKKKIVTIGSLLVTLGIVYGDIGTSPLYVMQAILGTNNNIVSNRVILGGVSLVFYTLLIQTTIKYILITLKADNKGEGGIFALYTLVKKNAKWLIIPAIIGGAAILADGILTPSISVTSAVEGLHMLFPITGNMVIMIVIIILFILFMFQRFGTEKIGKIFGPIMLIWFLMIGILGLIQITHNLSIIKALNPYYAIELIIHGGKKVIYILGAVFLCTTGAEALYSDLGHCGRRNIEITWILVKSCLLLSYFGQGAYLLSRKGEVILDNPFFLIMPESFIIIGIIIATLATIIASQALISGSFTLISEAIKLNIFPRLHIRYPNGEKGHIYIAAVNYALCIGAIGIVLLFKKSENMEAAYGLSITITMLMTTILLSQYIRSKNKPISSILVLIVFGTIELSFLYANSFKLFDGGYVTIIVTLVLIYLMYVWLYSSKIKKKYRKFVDLLDYKEKFKLIGEDKELPLYANNLVYLTKSTKWNKVENKILYSIFNKLPKRANYYWFVNIEVTDEPYTRAYKVNTIKENNVFSIEFKLGFRVSQGINSLLGEVIQELIEVGELKYNTKEYTIKSDNRRPVGNFKFILVEEVLVSESKFSSWDKFILGTKLLIKKFTVSPEKWYGIDTSIVEVEKVPIIVGTCKTKSKLKRLN